MGVRASVGETPMKMEAAVDAVFPFAGAGAVYASQPLQRCYRDLYTAGQ